MRFALRNKTKIIKAFGEPFYRELTESLQKHFKSNAALEKQQIEGCNYPVISIQSARTKNTTLQFAVTREMYDVLTLAYYKTIKE